MCAYAYSDFRWYSSLPSPIDATPDFLDGIGLRPDKFRQWLVKHVPISLARSDNWTLVCISYVQHCDATFEFSSCPVQKLQCYGLTTQLADEILRRAGEHYGELLPEQYILAALEHKLEQAVLAVTHHANSVGSAIRATYKSALITGCQVPCDAPAEPHPCDMEVPCAPSADTSPTIVSNDSLALPPGAVHFPGRFETETIDDPPSDTPL